GDDDSQPDLRAQKLLEVPEEDHVDAPATQVRGPIGPFRPAAEDADAEPLGLALAGHARECSTEVWSVWDFFPQRDFHSFCGKPVDAAVKRGKRRLCARIAHACSSGSKFEYSLTRPRPSVPSVRPQAGEAPDPCVRAASDRRGRLPPAPAAGRAGSFPG